MDWRTWSKKKLAGIGCLGLVGLLFSCATVAVTMDNRALSKLPPDARTATIAARTTARALRNATDTPQASATAEPSETPRASRTPVPTKTSEATATAKPTDTATPTVTSVPSNTPTSVPPTSVPPTPVPTRVPAAPLPFSAPVEQPPAAPPPAAAGPQPGTSADGGSCPDSHPYKGNRNSGKYHRPGCPHYSRTKAEECFASAADAEAAGYVRSGGD